MYWFFIMSISHMCMITEHFDTDFFKTLFNDIPMCVCDAAIGSQFKIIFDPP